MATYRLPLFPLQVVLLPGELLPLHIFEERYKLMIGECMEGDRPFGVVMVEPRGIRKVGCTARIVQLIEKFPDGRMNILTQGESRFTIVRTYDGRPYLEADVDPFEDKPGEGPSEDLVKKVLDTLGAGEEQSLSLPREIREDPVRLSFAVAAALRLPLQEKQPFLEDSSTRQRLERLLRLLELRRGRATLLRAHRRRGLGRNGHP